MYLNIEFSCDLDDVDTNGLIINEDNIYEYSNFSFIFKNEHGYSKFLAESCYISTLDIQRFINNLSNFRNNASSEFDLFGNLGYHSVTLKNKILAFSVMNYKEGYSFISYNIELNDENIQDIIDIFQKLFDYKQKIQDLFVSYDEEDEIINNNNIIQYD
jgi:hypothetical protein